MMPAESSGWIANYLVLIASIVFNACLYGFIGLLVGAFWQSLKNP